MTDSLYGARVAMEPVGLSLRYTDLASGDVHDVERDAFAPFCDEAVFIETSFDGEVLEVAVVPRRPVRMRLMVVTLRHAFATEEMVLLNGYQSWTDTAEHPPWYGMREWLRTSQVVADRYAADAHGDYSMVKYAKRRGEQHGFTFGTFRRGEGMVLVGSLCEDHGFTVIRTFAADGRVTLKPEMPVRMLDAGQRVVLGRWAVTRGTLDECYDRWFALMGVKARPVRPLVGYTSWYRHYYDIDEAKLFHDLEGMKGAPFVERIADEASKDGCSGAMPLFQIDDGYCKVGDWLAVDERKFPNGLAPFARAAREAGFLPGLWVAPFVCERDSRIFHECGDWLLHDDKGEPVRSGPQWSGGYALDTRNVEVRSYILDVLRTMTREWGFGLLKIDFLYAACMRARGGMNRGELMADALDLVREGVGDDTLILGCGVPLASAFGRVDYCRIGCDMGLDWDDKPHMRLFNRERVSTKNSIINTYSRVPLDGRAFGNDPDVFFLREDVKLSQAQRDELLFTNADCGTVFLTSDDMGAWNDMQRSRYDAALNVFLARHAGKGEVR